MRHKHKTLQIRQHVSAKSCDSEDEVFAPLIKPASASLIVFETRPYLLIAV